MTIRFDIIFEILLLARCFVRLIKVVQMNLMNKDKFKSSVEIGLLLLTAVVLGLISTYLPIIGVIVDFFWAVPFVVLTIRSDIKKAALALIAAVILLSLLIGSILAVKLALSFGVSGLALGYAIQKNVGAVRIFIFTLMISFAAQILSMMFMLFVVNIDVLGNQFAMVKESFEETFEVYKSIGMSQEEIDKARAEVEPGLELLSLLTPTLLLLMALINTTACFYAAKWIAPRMKFYIPDFPKFSTLRFPVAFLYLMVLALLGLYWGSTRNLQLLYTVSINANLLSMVVGFVQGLSILSFAADHFIVSKLVRRLIFVVIMINFMLFQIVAFTGLFDMLFDYRKNFSDRDQK